MELAAAAGLIALALSVGAYGTIIGAGGGFLLVPALAVLFGLDAAEAVGTTALTLALIRVTGTVGYHRQGLVEWPVAGWFALGAAPVALMAGWLLTDRLDSRALMTLIGFLLLALAAFVVIRFAWATGPARKDHHEAESHDGHQPVSPRRLPLLVGASGMGLLNGTFAVGAGLITVPYLAAVQRLRAHQAAATTMAAGTVGSTAATVGHSVNGNVRWGFAPLLFVGAVAGSWIGARWAGRLSEGTVMKLLAAGLLGAGVPLVLWG